MRYMLCVDFEIKQHPAKLEINFEENHHTLKYCSSDIIVWRKSLKKIGWFATLWHRIIKY